MGPRGRVAVVLLNWNSCQRTTQCLRDLNLCQINHWDIYLVDNGSSDNSVSLIASIFPNLNIIKNSLNMGFGGGCNVAIKKILLDKREYKQNYHLDCYEYALLLNTDAGMESSGFDKLISVMDTDCNIGVLGPLIVNKKTSTLLSAGGLDPSSNLRTYNRQELDSKDPTSAVFYVPGTVALLRTTVLLETGLFDEEYFFSCEMADLCARIWQNQYICAITPKVRAWHDMEESGDKRCTLYLYYILRNRFLYIKKFKKNRALILYSYWIFLGVILIVQALLKGRGKKARAIMYALSDGTRGRFGDRNYRFGDD